MLPFIDEGIALARDFPKIQSPQVRQAIIRMVSQVADQDENRLV